MSTTIARALALSVVTALAGAILASCGPAENRETEAGDDKRYKVSPIVGVKGDDFYGSLACGARQAAEKLASSLTCKGPTSGTPPNRSRC
jgi:ribose transport system substrate-binding protein